jgi:hypothetical protein
MALFVLLCFSVVVSVKAALMWSRTYGGTGDDKARSLVVTSDGGYAIAGFTDSFGAGDRDFWLVKTDACGNMQWNKTYGGAGADEAWSLIATSDGGYALAGYTSSFGAGTSDFWLVKTDSIGTMAWNKTYGGAGLDFAESLVATSDGGYALAGTTRSFGTDDDFWLVKTDASGNMEWNRTYAGTDADYARSLVVTSDGGYAIAGMTWFSKDTGFFSSEDYDFWLVKTNSLGNIQWNKTYTGYDNAWAYSLVVTSDGGYALAGSTARIRSSKVSVLLVKTDASGNMEWNRTYGGTGEDRAYSLVAASDGGYAIAGYTRVSGASGGDFWLIKTDEIGVAPEYPPWVIPLLMLTATAFIIINKKRLLHIRS